MDKQRAGKNRTITVTPAEEQYYFLKCLTTESIKGGSGFLNSVICGDSFEVMDLLPPKFADLLIVDPPYNIFKQFGKITFRKISEQRYLEYTLSWIVKAKRLLKDNASIYVCCDWQSSATVAEALKKHFYIQNRITWQREKGRGAQRNWKNALEDIWFATMSAKSYTFNASDVKLRKLVMAPYRQDGKPKDWVESEEGYKFRDTYPSNFWSDISIPYWSMPENTDHPTQKPEKLMAKLILASSNPGDVVLDPMLGSGTTAVAAKKLGRRYVGIEIERGYCAVAAKRLENAREGDPVQGYSDGVFWERNTAAFQKKFKKR